MSLSEKERAFSIAIFLLTVAVFSAKVGCSFLSSEMGGEDLIGNYAMLCSISESVRNGDLTFWSNQMLSGVMFSLYSPLFFILAVTASYVLPLELAYKLLISLSICLFPVIIFISMKRSGLSGGQSAAASSFSLVFIFFLGFWSLAHFTLNLGLVSHTLGLLFFIAYLGCLNEDSYIKKGLLLSLILLSNALVFILPVITEAVFNALNPSKRNMKITICSFILAFGISAFWLYPFISNLGLMLTSHTQPVDITDNLHVLPLFLLLPFALLGKPYRLRKILIILLLISLFIAFADLGIFQCVKFFFYSVMIMSILIPVGLYGIMAEHVPKRRLKLLNMSLAAALVVLAAILPVNNQWENLYGETDEIVSWVSENVSGGRILTDRNVFPPGTPFFNLTAGKEIDMKEAYKDMDMNPSNQLFVIAENIPISTEGEIINDIHAEISPSSEYGLFLQREISKTDIIRKEFCFMCDCYNGFDKELMTKQFKRFNIRYFIATDNFDLADCGFLLFRTRIGNFSVFEAPWESEYYEIPEYRPVLVISENDNDWKELNRIVFNNKELIDIIFVRDGENIPDDYEDVFGCILDLDGNSASDSFFHSRDDDESVESFLDRVKDDIFIRCNTTSAVREFSYGRNNISFSVGSGETVPVLLKFTYSPSWAGNNKIFMASPSLMLVLAKGDVYLETKPDAFGYTMTILSLSAVVFISIAPSLRDRKTL